MGRWFLSAALDSHNFCPWWKRLRNGGKKNIIFPRTNKRAVIHIIIYSISYYTLADLCFIDQHSVWTIPVFQKLYW